ncbi:hypothetical protein QUF88_19155 [Bacillus sp. DX1.1]|uniref:hypothetical protein n=1 Tax=unclassified Bacillus (in: firmicutes) TaxID=185979 RepID=UPI0025701EED|nr:MULTISPECIES: hypothetical protein [unclassified Bacillus (in: firmicutes)]MDM5155830.1 hypothetical protein [Bacillus sp. DX1.1]WJE80127.1 hypothetical protein QRE67_16685 [Bacillus sp. DX3.1]
MKKPFYKKWWFWVIIFVVLGVLGTNINNKNKDAKPAVAETKSKDTKKEAKKTGLTVDEYTKRINSALDEMGDKTKLKISSSEVVEDGRTAIALSNNIFIFLETDKDKIIKKVSLGMTSKAYFTEMEDFKFAFLLLIGTVDESLSFGERNLVKQELGISDEKVFSKDHTKSYKKNGIMYTYKGNIKEDFILQAKF